MERPLYPILVLTTQAIKALLVRLDGWQLEYVLVGHLSRLRVRVSISCSKCQAFDIFDIAQQQKHAGLLNTVKMQ
jgi:hypothetical protein